MTNEYLDNLYLTCIDINASILEETSKQFKYRRSASLSHLADLARSRHYSTFSLYQKDEFEAVLQDFRENIEEHFSNPEQIEWDDEYTMLVVKKRSYHPGRQ